MSKRIRKKILGNKNHPRRNSEIRKIYKAFENYARGECKRLSLNPDRWGSYAISWPSSLMYWNRFIY